MKILRSKKNPVYTSRHASFTASLDAVSPAHSWSNPFPAGAQHCASGAINFNDSLLGRAWMRSSLRNNLLTKALSAKSTRGFLHWTPGS